MEFPLSMEHIIKDGRKPKLKKRKKSKEKSKKYKIEEHPGNYEGLGLELPEE